MELLVAIAGPYNQVSLKWGLHFLKEISRTAFQIYRGQRSHVACLDIKSCCSG